MPDALLTPRGSAGAFAEHVHRGARVLDLRMRHRRALAVGLALRGCDVVATDASAAMVARTARLAAEHGAELQASTCTWEQLAGRGWDGAVRTYRERLAFWPFPRGAAARGHASAGLEPEGAAVPGAKAGRYRVTARRARRPDERRGGELSRRARHRRSAGTPTGR